MNTTVKLRPTALTKPPLLEAIFEMRWDLAPVPNSQVRRDPAYPLLYGRFYDRFKKEYGIVEDLPSVQAHPDASPYVVRHRLRKAADQWPLVQIGPGIITVNEGKHYSWESFREEIVRFFEAFTDFYPASSHPLKVVKTELRFINGVEIEEGTDPIAFLSQKMHTKVELDPALFGSNQVLSVAEGMTLNVGYRIQKPEGHVMLGIGSGEVSEKPAILQQMVFHSSGEEAPQDLGSLDPWLDSMHKVSKSWFETLFRGELLKQFTV